MDPYVVSRVRAQDLKPIETHEPQVLSTAMTPENAKELQQMMAGRGQRRHRPQCADSRR